ncbi:MAG: hypothetical protein JWN43_1091 [Gammaproteobacteria bacterium]|nr:hypothetical protein [Gammaproteobacteria bacterium]
MGKENPKNSEPDDMPEDERTGDEPNPSGQRPAAPQQPDAPQKERAPELK